MNTIGICICIAALGPDGPPTGIEVNTVVLRPIHDVSIPAQETGLLLELPVEEGQMIKAGSLLARIDDADAKSAVAEAIADHEVAVVDAKSDLAIQSAKKDLESAAKKLRAVLDDQAKNPKHVRQYEVDEAQLVETQARLAVERAKLLKQKASKTAAAKSERVNRAKERLKRHSVFSPISGSVVESRFERGEWVEPGQVIARVVQTNRLRAEGLLLPSQIEGSLVGAPVTVLVRIGKRDVRLRGKVTFVSSEALAHKVRMRAIVENPGQLVRPGVMGATMTIHPLSTAKNASGSRR